MPKNPTESKKATNTDKITRVNSCRNQIALPLWPSKRPFPSLVPANPFVRGREVLHSDSPGHGTSCDHLVWQHSTHSQAMVLITAQFKQLSQISARCSQMEEFYILPFKLFLLEAYLWEHNEVKGELQSGWSFTNPPCYFPHPRHPPSLLPSQDGILFHPYSLEENGPATTIKSQSFHSQFRYTKNGCFPCSKGHCQLLQQIGIRGNTGVIPPLGSLWMQILTAGVTKDESMDLPELPTEKDFSDTHTFISPI